MKPARCSFSVERLLFGQVTDEDLGDRRSFWSGRRDSNPRPQPWQGCALPLSYARAPMPRQQQACRGKARIIQSRAAFASAGAVAAGAGFCARGRVPPTLPALARRVPPTTRSIALRSNPRGADRKAVGRVVPAGGRGARNGGALDGPNGSRGRAIP